jgi:putrescine transport system ATP-binding protein
MSHTMPAGPSGSLLSLQGICKRFGSVTALDEVSLEISENEFLALLGPSGCGKTTLLRMMAGLERPNAGRILLDGSDITAVPPYARPVNMMFQSYALFPHMTVEQNIGFGLRQEHAPKPEIQRRVAEMLDLVQLGGFGKRKPHQLSGGQRQRVALARALVKRPKMLLLDEPLGALDKKLREQTQFELMNIQEELGITFVIVTHDQEEAMTVSSRIAVMDHGRIVQVATPTEIYEYPNTRYVAGFIGDVNMFPGQVASIATNAMEIASKEAGCRIQVVHGPDTRVGNKVWVAIRPEKLQVSLEAPEDPTINCLSGVVWDIGYLGNLSIYHVRLQSGLKVTSSQTNRTRLVERPISWDDPVYLTWAPETAVVLTA